MESLKKPTTAIFWFLFLAFLVVLAEFFLPAFRVLFRGSELFLVPLAIFSLLGLILLILSLKEKAEGRLKKFLVLTGASALGFFIFILLHNLVSGLLTELLNSDFEEPVFFILAIIVCPLGYLTGLVGSLVLLIKRKNS